MSFLFKKLDNKFPFDGSNYDVFAQKALRFQSIFGLWACVFFFFVGLSYHDQFLYFALFPIYFFILYGFFLLSGFSKHFNEKVLISQYSGYFSILFISLITHSPTIPLILVPMSFAFLIFYNPNYIFASKHLAIFVFTGGIVSLCNYLFYPDHSIFYLNLIIGIFIIQYSAFVVLLFVYLFSKTIELHKVKESQFNKAQIIANLGSFEYDLTTNKLVWSDQLYRIYGYEPKSIQPSFDLFLSHIHPEDKEAFLATLNNSMQKGGQYQARERIIRPNGEERILTTIGAVDLDTNGNPLKVNGVCRDITEDLIAQTALKQSESRYQALFENAFDGILIFDLKQKIKLDCNDKLCDYFDLTREHLLFSKNFDFLFQQQSDEHAAFNNFDSLANILKQKGSVHSEYDHINKNGFLLSFEISIFSLPAPNKNLGVLILKDITERKKSKTALLKSNFRFQSIFETSAMGILITDINTSPIKINNTFSKMLGYSKEELNGQILKKVTHPDDIELSKQKIDELLNGDKQIVKFDKRYIRKDGSIFWARLWVNIFEEEGQKRLQATIQDISEQVQWKQDIIHKNLELEKYIESNLQLESFAYVASHDLKAPLRTIISFSQLLQRQVEAKLSANEKEYLNFVISATHNLNNLVEALLQFSIIGSKEKRIQAFSIHALIQTITQELNIDIEKNKINIIIEEMPEIILGDITRIRQLLQNLISNSIKFKNKTKQPTIIISCKEVKTKYIFSVSDNGIGIKNEYLEKIFLMFRKLNTSDQYEGTGMGLAICKKIIEQHNGKIWVESTFGNGTTFFFSLPKKQHPTFINKKKKLEDSLSLFNS